MKKPIIKKVFSTSLISIIFCFLFLFFSLVGGQGPPADIPGMSETTIIKALATILGWIAMGIGVGLIVFGLFKLVTSMGEPQGIAEGRQTLLWGVIAIGIGGMLYVGFQGITIEGVSFEWAIREISKWLGYASWGIGIGLVLFSFFKLITSMGDPKMIAEAKQGLLWGVIAIGIGLMLYTGFQGITIGGVNFEWAIRQVSMWLGYVCMIFSIGLLMFSIFKIVVSRGDPKMLEEAKTNLVWSFIGIGFGALFISGALLDFIFS